MVTWFFRASPFQGLVSDLRCCPIFTVHIIRVCSTHNTLLINPDLGKHTSPYHGSDNLRSDDLYHSKSKCIAKCTMLESDWSGFVQLRQI